MSQRKSRTITIRAVEALKSGDIIWDSNVKGFGCRCQRQGKSYVLKTRVRGRQRWMTIGRHGSPWTPDTARSEARRLLGEIEAGEDPAGIRDQKKDNPTVSELAVMFLERHVAPKLKASTAYGYADFLNRLVLPKIGKLKVDQVTEGDIARLHHELKGSPYQANRVLAVVSKMFGWAERHGYRERGANPAKHVERYRENKRERFLSSAEYGRLADALAQAETDGRESPFVIAAIRLLVFTGARLSEILTLKWEHVDFERALLLLADSKTGQKAIPLPAPALEVLASLPRIENNPYVVCGAKPGAHLINLQKPWRRIRKKAQLDDVRIHDLRHSFASAAAATGASLPLIGKMLGHTQAQTTQRYAHLADDPVRAAGEKAVSWITRAMEGGRDAEIVKLRDKN